MGGDSVGHSCSICWRHLGDAYWMLLYTQFSQCADRSLQKCMIHSQLVLWHPSKREASLAEQTFLTEMLMQRSIFYLISVHERLESVGRSDLVFSLPGMNRQIRKTSQVRAWFWNWWLLYSFTLVPLEGGGVFVPSSWWLKAETAVRLVPKPLHHQVDAGKVWQIGEENKVGMVKDRYKNETLIAAWYQDNVKKIAHADFVKKKKVKRHVEEAQSSSFLGRLDPSIIQNSHAHCVNPQKPLCCGLCQVQAILPIPNSSQSPHCA